MYETHFGFREKPFTLLPDPAFLFLGKRHSAALSLLEYSLENQAGFAVLTGAIGSGKTTLIRHLLEHAAQDVVVGLISNTHRNLGELLVWVLLAFGLKPPGKDKAELYQAFVDFLLEQYAANRHTVLIVDEAQNLGPDALEELRLLSNINADKHQVLQTILVGQPELQDLLRQPELTQFAQRISAYFHLDPLDPAETAAYIRHRITLAGGDPELFHTDACRLVHRYSGGVPRVVNVICDTALVYGYGAELPRIGVELVREVVWDKVQAGLFSVPEGIDPGELAAAHGSEASEASGDEAASAGTDNARTTPPGSPGAPETDLPKSTGPAQGKAPQTGYGEPENKGDAATEQPVPSAPGTKGEFSGPAPRAARLGFPSGPTVTSDPGNALGGERQGMPGAGGQRAAGSFAAEASDHGGRGSASLQGGAGGSRAETPVNPLPYERRAPARKGWLRVALAVALGAPVLFYAGQALNKLFADQALQERVSETSQQNAPQPVTSALNSAPAAEQGAAPPVNGMPPAVTVVSDRDAIAPFDTFGELSSASMPPEPNPLTTPLGATEGNSAAESLAAGAHEPVEQSVTEDGPPAAPEDTRPAPADVVSATAPEPRSAGTPASAVDAGPESQSGTPTQDTERKIARLLRLAEQALVESRLTTPEEGSAFYCYQRVLELDAENTPAREGIDAIVGRYARMAESALARNDYDKAQRYLIRGLRVQPDDSALLALKAEVAGAPR